MSARPITPAQDALFETLLTRDRLHFNALDGDGYAAAKALRRDGLLDFAGCCGDVTITLTDAGRSRARAVRAMREAT